MKYGKQEKLKKILLSLVVVLPLVACGKGVADTEPMNPQSMEMEQEGEAEQAPSSEVPQESEPVQKASNDEFEEKIEMIREIYYDIQERLELLEQQDGGSGTTRYLEGDQIRKIVTSKDTYESMGHEAKYAAEYYYQNHETVFVFVYGNGEEYRFYLNPQDDSQCIRYIDSDGVIYDFPKGMNASDISEVGYFCTMSMLELHWAGIIP